MLFGAGTVTQIVLIQVNVDGTFLGRPSLRGVGVAPAPSLMTGIIMSENSHDISTLNGLIATTLDGDASVLPEHVRQKVRDRVAAAVRKDPARQTNFEPLDAKLQFCDLRELQDVTTAKTLWPRFEPVFGGKGKVSMFEMTTLVNKHIK